MTLTKARKPARKAVAARHFIGSGGAARLSAPTPASTLPVRQGLPERIDRVEDECRSIKSGALVQELLLRDLARFVHRLALSGLDAGINEEKHRANLLSVAAKLSHYAGGQ